MRYKDIHPTFREAIAAFELFRRMGFTPDQIFWHLNGNEPLERRYMFAMLKAQGKEFNFRLGIVKLSWEEWQREWVKLSEYFTDEMPQSLRDRIFNESEAYSQRVPLLAAIVKKGFRVNLNPHAS
jgi:hypothetical protein